MNHYQEAERLAEQAEAWRDFERWPLTTDERIGWTQADATLALVHATLAVAAATSRIADDDDRIASVVDAEQRTLRVAAKGMAVAR